MGAIVGASTGVIIMESCMGAIAGAIQGSGTGAGAWGSMSMGLIAVSGLIGMSLESYWRSLRPRKGSGSSLRLVLEALLAPVWHCIIRRPADMTRGPL